MQKRPFFGHLLHLFSLPGILLAQEIFLSSYKGETAITYKPGNPNIMVAGSNDYTNPQFRVASYRTLNGGYTSADWITVTLPLPSGKTDAGDPTLDYDANGNVFYCFTAYEIVNQVPDRGGIYVCKSTNNGQSWLGPYFVDLPEITTDHDDKPWMIVDRTRNPNRIYVAWTLVHKTPSGSYGDLMFAYSDNGGASFGGLQTLAAAAPVGEYYPNHHGAAMALGSNGNLYVTWVEDKVKSGEIYQSDGSTIFIAKSTDGGVNFQSTVAIKANFNSAKVKSGGGSFRFNSFPTVTTSPTTGYIHVAWCEYENSTTLRLHTKRSTNGGSSWIDETTLPAPISNTEQWSPFLTSNSLGRVFVTFYNFDSSNNAKLFTESSTNNGLSFGESYPHSTVNSNSANGKGVTDYIGAIAPSDNPLPSTLWMDFRNGQPSPNQRGDVFFDKKLHLASNVNTATAGNGQRKLVKGQAANEYHLVYEANGEIWYTKTTDGGTTWSAEKLISERSGTNSSPGLAMRGSAIYVVW